MAVDASIVADLRAQTGAGILECKKALEESNGDMQAAIDILRKKGAAKAAKKTDRETKEGLVYAYVHGTGKSGAMIEVLCETDFVARNEQFKEFVHDLAMQIVAMSPLYVSPEEIPAEHVQKEKELAMEEFAGSGKPQEMIEKIAEGKLGKWYEDVCLLKQRFIKDEDVTIEELVKSKIATIGENIQIKRFTRYSI
jgi:elongation factor Ts